MSPFTLTIFLALALVPGGQALVRFRSVGDKCRYGIGWPGHTFSNDPWGLVVNPQLVSSSSGSVTAVPTDSVLPTGAGGVEASPTSRPGVAFTAYSSPSLSFSSSNPASTASPSLVSNSSTDSPSSTTKSFITKVSSHTNSPSKPPPSTSSTPTPSAPSTLPSSLSNSPSVSSSSPVSSASSSGSGTSNTGSSTSNANPGSVASGSTSGPTSQSDIDAYLTGHNSVRTAHAAPPLAYSQDLASKAQQWANRCVFAHSDGTLGSYGENLAAGTGDGFGIPQAIKLWTDEASSYDPNNPIPSHFTQVVWKGTTQVGCALQNCDGIFSPEYGKAHFYVCEYSPPGNVDGEYSTNVQA